MRLDEYPEVSYGWETFGVFGVPVADVDADGFHYFEEALGKLKKNHVYATRATRPCC